MTDTGSFRFPSTSSKTHRIIANLIDKGANNAEIHNKIYDTKSYERLQLLGCALTNLKVIPEYRTAYITLSQEELDTYKFQKGDTEGIVNYGLSLNNIVFAAIFIENQKENIVKISLRSKGDFSVNEFSRAHFSGGGHTNAAGGRSDLSLSETIDKFISILPNYKHSLNPMRQLIILCLIAVTVFGCKSPEARLPETVSSGSFFKESIERNKKLNESEYQKIKDIIAKNPDRQYIASESGFWYFYETKIEQDTIQATFGDLLNFDYDVKDLNENTIYSKEELGNQNYAMDQEELFTGLREGLKLMKPSETVTFLFPSQKAYGYYGDTKKIGTNIPLICKVTLNTITPKKNDE